MVGVKIVIVYDTETSTHGVIDANTNELKVFAYVDTNTGETNTFRETEKEKIKEVLYRNEIYVGYNNKVYDNVVLSRAGYRIRGHVIDLYEVIKNKAPIMKTKFRKGFSLKQVLLALGLSNKSDDIDYEWLNKEETIIENWTKIKEYTLQDIKITAELWEYMKEYFEPFKELLSERDKKMYKHLTLSSGSYAYKVICRKTGMKEEYDDNTEYSHYEGGYVSTPSTEIIKGKIYCMDYNSAYTMGAYTQANLFSNRCLCCKEEEKYVGNGLFKLSGSYCTKKLGVIEKLLLEWYDKRKVLKSAGDSKEHTYKVLLNVFYGICGNPVFKNLYNINTASDCTLMAREMIKLARSMYADAGYNVIYSDTDSVYLEDPFNNEARLEITKQKIIEEIKSGVPFPNERFDMGVDDRIKLMYFPGKKKKNYLYVTEDDELIVKGLPIIKNNASKIGTFVYYKYIKPYIISEQKVIIKNERLKGLVRSELEKDISLATVEWKTKEESFYKLPSQIQAQISRRYGKGIHYLIPNLKNIGVGIGKSYCTTEEFIKEKLTFNDIDLDKTYSELEIFSDGPLKTIKVRRGRGKKLVIKNNTLGEWMK